MWFGTTDGLYRYDGTTVSAYKHNPADSTSICHNNINAITEDHNRNLWIGTSRGVSLYDRNLDSFIDINAIPENENELTNAYITSLSADTNGRLWIGTRGGGVNVYDKQAFRFTPFYAGNTKDNYQASDYVFEIIHDAQKMWVATRAGLRAFDTHTLKPISIDCSEKKILTKEITNLVSDKHTNLIVATRDGEIFSLTEHQNTYKATKLTQIIRTDGSPARIIRLGIENSTLWIATENAGLKSFDVVKKKLTQYYYKEGDPYSLPGSEIWCVYTDDQNMVWFGSYYKGVYFIDNKSKKFDLYQRNPFKENTLRSNNITAFAPFNDQHIVIASDSGLNKFSLNKRTVIYDALNSKAGNVSITALIRDANNNFWLGTRNDGVIRIEHQTLRATHFDVSSSGTGNNKIISLYQDKSKMIWAGTLGSGLFYFDETKNRFISLCERDKANYVPDRAFVTAILESSDSTIWVGTLYGLYRLKRSGPNTYNYQSYFEKGNPHDIASDRIQVIYEDSRKQLWFGTVDNGLSLWLGEQSGFRNIHTQHDLQLFSVKEITEDHNGLLWISSGEGIMKVDPKKGLLKNYTKFDGLSSNGFNPGASLRLESGELVFGGNNGFDIFHPDSIQDNHNPPQMWLSDFKLNNQPVRIGEAGSPLSKHIGLTQKISLAYNQRSFSIDFIGIYYGASAKNQYCYMLEGFDKDWNCIGSNNTAVYTNLDAGHYVFLAKGANSDGVWSTTPARLEITIHPPFWKTWWAITAYILIIGGTLYAISKVRMEKMRMVNQLNLEKMAREKEHELTLSKMQFFTNISHEIRTPLSLIAVPIESLVSSAQVPREVRMSMHVAYKNVNYLTRLITELMDFSKMDTSNLHLRVQYGELVKFIKEIGTSFTDISDKRNIGFTIESNHPAVNGWFDREKIEKVILNLLSNAFKFTRDHGYISLVIDVVNDSSSTNESNRLLKIVIIDNGIGISPDELPHIFDKFFQAKSAYQVEGAGTGIGLSLTRELLDLHHGSIQASSTPDQGTKFTITFPIDQHAYRNDEIVDMPIDIIDDPQSSITEEHAADNPAPDVDKPEILIIEDNDELRDLLVTEFSSSFSIITSRDGEHGLQLAQERIPDLIISDVVMPHRSGLDLCQSIKSDIRTSHIPVILLTAKTAIDDQLAGLDCGADLYITKPFSLRVLKSHAKQIIVSRKKLYAHFSQDAYLLPTQVTNNKIDQEFLKKAIDFIHENVLNDQLSIEAIAEPLNLSKNQFYKKIKALTGQTAVEFIKTIRLKYALTLMETKRYTIAEIAYLAGFSSPSYFTRSFKEQFGKPPSDYIRPK